MCQLLRLIYSLKLGGIFLNIFLRIKALKLTVLNKAALYVHRDIKPAWPRSAVLTEPYTLFNLIAYGLRIKHHLGILGHTVYAAGNVELLVTHRTYADT